MSDQQNKSTTKRLDKRRVFISGGSSGFGLALMKIFIKQGARCLLLARDRAKLKRIKRRYENHLDIYPCDLSDPKQLQGFLDYLVEWSPDIVINNAAQLGPVGSTWQVDRHALQITQQVNYLAPLAICQSVLPAMIEKAWGRIVNISGGGAATCRPYYAAYACSKSALNKLTEILAAEIPHSCNVTINSIAPGMMNTNILEACYQHSIDLGNEAETKKIETKLAQKETFAATNLCLELCYDKAQLINGKLLSAEWDDWYQIINRQLALPDEVFTIRRVLS